MRVRDLATGAGLVGLSALLFSLSFPTRSLAALAWIALVPLFVSVRRGGLGAALFLTWLWCVVGACLTGDWFPRSVAHYFGQPMVVAIALFAGVFTLMAAPYLCAFTAAYRVLARGSVLGLPFAVAAAWTAAELGRGRLFLGTPLFVGNPWGLLGYSQADLHALVQIAAFTGIYGVSFAVACVNAALAEVVLSWREPARRDRAIYALPLALLPAAGFAVYGHLALRNAGPGAPAEAVRVGIAQGNIDVGAHWRSDAYGKNLDVYLELTDAAARRAAPAVVFWPESAMTFFLEREDVYRRGIGAFLARRGIQLVAGGPRLLGDEPDARYTNSIFVVDPDGSISARYDKQHLVPFAEYFPIGIDVLRRSFGRIRTFEHGTQVAPISTRAGPAGVLVCNESMLPEAARERVRAGAVYLLNPSNDTWISDPDYTEQQFDIASLRAVEQRRWLVRASTAGPSAIVDPWGRETVRTEPLERAVAVGEIWPRSELTLYARAGDAFALACVAVALLGVLHARRRR